MSKYGRKNEDFPKFCRFVLNIFFLADAIWYFECFVSKFGRKNEDFPFYLFIYLFIYFLTCNTTQLSDCLIDWWILNCIVLYCNVLYCIVLYILFIYLFIYLFFNMQYKTIERLFDWLMNIKLYCIVSYWVVLYCIVL